MKYAIAKEEINQKPLLEYTGPIHLIHEDSQVAGAVEVLTKERLLGFDTETRPAFRKGEFYLPSLLQLGGASAVWLFQLRRLKDLGPVMDLLARREILKAGVAVSRDVSELQQLHPFKPAGFEDIGHMAEKRGFHNTGLRPLTALLLNGRVSKAAQVSNWAADTLTDKQLVYAATDAWASRKLYEALIELPEAPRRDESTESETSA